MNIAETPPFHLGRLFGKFTKLYIGVVTKKLEALPIERYFYVLLIIEKSPERLTQKNIANILEMDKTGTARLLDYLEQNKMVKREVNPDDRRVHFITLTPEAKAHLPKIEKAFVNANEKAMDGFGEKEKVIFYQMLNKLICNLSQEPGDSIQLDFSKIKLNKKTK